MARSESWQKSMWRYGRHCHSDAHALATWLREESITPLPVMRRHFEEAGPEVMFLFELEHEQTISDLIRRADSQRASIINKFRKAHGQGAVETLLLVSIIISVRLSSILDRRDDYRRYLVPGGGYRETAKEVYSFSRDIMRAGLAYIWPDEVFMNVDMQDWDDENGNDLM